MVLEIGDIIVNKSFEEPIYRKIIEVRETGYSWIYPDVPDKEFYSEDSSDPFFDWKWELVNMQDKKMDKEDLSIGYYLTKDGRLGSFQGYKTVNDEVIVALVDVFMEKFFVNVDELIKVSNEQAGVIAEWIRCKLCDK